MFETGISKKLKSNKKFMNMSRPENIYNIKK